jgi:tRNA (cmo5U34)-methyltransferase
MPAEQPPKPVCQLCGGNHPTDEHELQTQSEPKERTTNIGHEGLNYDQEHYTAEEYEDDIRRSIPGYEELHQKIDEVVAEHATDHDVDRMLDLGVGTGLTAERLLKIMPTASLTAVDRFENENMRKGAEERLEGSKVKFLKGDYSEIDFGRSYEIIEAVIGIHHQTDEGKRKLFKKVFDALKPGGIFIFGDLVTYRDGDKAKENEEKHFEHLREHARNEQSLQEWEKHHREDNLLAPIEDQIEWLKEAGFFEVEVKFEHLNTVLIIAKK